MKTCPVCRVVHEARVAPRLRRAGETPKAEIDRAYGYLRQERYSRVDNDCWMRVVLNMQRGTAYVECGFPGTLIQCCSNQMLHAGALHLLILFPRVPTDLDEARRPRVLDDYMWSVYKRRVSDVRYTDRPSAAEAGAPVAYSRSPWRQEACGSQARLAPTAVVMSGVQVSVVRSVSVMFTISWHYFHVLCFKLCTY